MINDWEKLDLLADKIKQEYLKTNKSKKELEKICEKHNIILEDYLYIEGYNDFSELKEEV